MKNDRLEKIFKARFNQAVKYQMTLAKQWERLTNYYHLIDPDNRFRFVSFLRDYANSIRVRWISSIFAGDDFFGLQGEEFTDDKPASAMEQLIKYQTRKNRLIMRLKQMFLPLSYLGTKVLMSFWDEANNRPESKSTSSWDFFPDPYGDSRDTCNWIITRELISLDALRNLEERGIVRDINEISGARIEHQPEGQGSNAEKTGDEVLETARGIKADQLPTKTGDDDNKVDQKVLVYEMWTKAGEVFTYEPKTGHFIHTDDKNPFDHGEMPFAVFRPLPEEGMFYGLSPVESLLELNLELNENRYYKRKNMDLVMQGIWLGKRGTNIDWDRLKKQAICLSNDISENTIRRIPVDNVLEHIERDETSIRFYGDRSSNIYDPQRGGGEGQVTKTYRGLNLLVTEGNYIFAEHIANIQLEGMQDLVRQYVALNQQYLNDEVVIRLTNKQQSVRADRANIQGSFDYKITSSPGLLDKEGRQVAISNLQTKYAQDPEVNQRKLKEKEFKVYDIDPDEVLLPEEEVDLKIENEQLKAQIAAVDSEIAQAQQSVTRKTIKDAVTPPKPEPVEEEMMV